MGWSGNHALRLTKRQRKEDGLDYYPAPTIDDDLYGLGVSIWELYTGKIPHGDDAEDDVALKDILLRGETVDLMEVADEEARDIIRDLLRQGGAHV